MRIVNNNDGSYDYRHGVHYIRIREGMVFGITFRLPISANPVATRNVNTDSGWYIND